jgi:hypothetical protein
MNADPVSAIAANARGFDALLVALFVFTVAIGITILMRDRGGFTAIHERVVERARRAAPAWVADTILAAGMVAYALLGAAPMFRHEHFLYNTYPLSAAVATFAIGVGFLAVLLAFLV